MSALYFFGHKEPLVNECIIAWRGEVCVGNIVMCDSYARWEFSIGHGGDPWAKSGKVQYPAVVYTMARELADDDERRLLKLKDQQLVRTQALAVARAQVEVAFLDWCNACGLVEFEETFDPRPERYRPEGLAMDMLINLKKYRSAQEMKTFMQHRNNQMHLNEWAETDPELRASTRLRAHQIFKEQEKIEAAALEAEGR